MLTGRKREGFPDNQEIGVRGLLRCRQLMGASTSARPLGPFDFDLAAGECLAVTGASGSGKSQFLRMVADLDPHKGGVWLDSIPQQDFSGSEWRRKVLYCPSESGWWSERVFNHMPDNHVSRGLGKRIGLDEAAFVTAISGLSTGERQRLALVRALCCEPKVLLLDEPTSALDWETILKVEDVLRDLMSEGMSVLLVSHDRAQVSRLAGRCLQIADGQFRARD